MYERASSEAASTEVAALQAHVLAPRSRGELVAEAIKTAILQGDLHPGQPLVERELAAVYGTSKTPVREALKILSHSQLVTMSTNRGATVRVVDAEMVRSVHNVRLLLEPAAVRDAVPHHTPETLAAARQWLEQATTAEQEGDRYALSVANRSFHSELYAPCGNSFLLSILSGIQDQAVLITISGWERMASYELEHAEHERILAAVERGDEEGAEEALRAHILRFSTRLLSALGDPSV